jgi:hypothetical protein
VQKVTSFSQTGGGGLDLGRFGAVEKVFRKEPHLTGRAPLARPARPQNDESPMLEKVYDESLRKSWLRKGQPFVM